MIAGFPTLISMKDQCEAVHDSGLRCMRHSGHPPHEKISLPDGAGEPLDNQWHWNSLGQDKYTIWMDDIRDRMGF